MLLNFYFHWIDIGHSLEEWLAALAWDPSYATYDEGLLSVVLSHKEGLIPSLIVEVENPHIGLLKPGRPTWAWLSYDDDGVPKPMFFGRLVGTPTDLLGQVVTLEFTARSIYYVRDKQIAAEALKVRPNWDPVFISLAKQNDPDTILEGHSKLWHVDRVSLAITPSDILTGEDGIVTFLPTDVPYDSVRVNLKQVPLTAIAVNASVSWAQQYTGHLDTISGKINSYSGDGIFNEWPKVLTQLGSGWSVYSSSINDIYKINSTKTASFSSHWESQAEEHHDGDSLTIDRSKSYPVFDPETTFLQQYMVRHIVPGYRNPFALDRDGDPAPINRPSSSDISESLVPMWKLKYILGLRYDVDRARTERLQFILSADTQPVITSPLVTQETEVIDISGADVGVPIINLKNWTSIAGKSVELGQFIFPDDPSIPGQRSIQVCTTAGIAGLVEPAFSNVAGVTTVDGVPPTAVVWTSLGTAANLSNTIDDWVPFTITPLGDTVLPRVRVSIAHKALVEPGLDQEPRVGTPVSKYQIVLGPQFGYFQCSVAGTTWTPGVSTSRKPDWNAGTVLDGSVTWEFIGVALPTGIDYFICTNAGTTGEFLPHFGEGTKQVSDGTVVWTNIGQVSVPVGGAPGKTPANNYFPSDRGLWSVEYLLNLARARLRMRSRAVEISFDCRFEKATQLSCRMMAQIYDERLPGCVALGKVIAYTLKAHGDSKEIIANVTIGCAVGEGIALVEVEGTPSYAEDGYAQKGWQRYDGAYITPNDDGDVGYVPPVAGASGDDFVFPLTGDQVFLDGGIKANGDLDRQADGIIAALYSAYLAANNYIDGPPDPDDPPGPPEPPDPDDTPESRSLEGQFLGQQAAQNSVQNNLLAAPIWLELDLKPVNGIKFDNIYTLQTSSLVIPKMIDLEAEECITAPLSGPTIWFASA